MKVPWALVFFVALASFVVATARDLGVFLERTPASTGCRLLQGSDAFRSSEDQALWNDGEVVVSAGDLGEVFEQGVAAAAPGALYAVSLAPPATYTRGRAEVSSVRLRGVIRGVAAASSSRPRRRGRPVRHDLAGTAPS